MEADVITIRYKIRGERVIIEETVTHSKLQQMKVDESIKVYKIFIKEKDRKRMIDWMDSNSRLRISKPVVV